MYARWWVVVLDTKGIDPVVIVVAVMPGEFVKRGPHVGGIFQIPIGRSLIY